MKPDSGDNGILINLVGFSVDLQCSRDGVNCVCLQTFHAQGPGLHVKAENISIFKQHSSSVFGILKF
jgi:hypothetical protein